MRKISKIVYLSLIVTIILQSCSSDESGSGTDIISEKQKISTELADKILATASSINDFNLINFECESTFVTGYFLNYQGDYFKDENDYLIPTSKSDWDTAYTNFKNLAFDTTNVLFTDEDFVIESVLIFDNLARITIFVKEEIKDYFKNCELNGKLTFFPPSLGIVTLPEINFNCSGDITFHLANDDGEVVYAFQSVKTSLSEGMSTIENRLSSFNQINQTSYTTDNLFITSVEFTSPANTTALANGREQMINYFEDCKLDKDVNNNDCLNFIYPLKIDRFNIQSEEIVTTTIENDEDLINIFNSNVGELSIDYPINLLGGDNTTLTVETNEELLETLNQSAIYCGHQQ
ncbi:hypothetical protein A8C32_13840 [Flavivirga aquatica]|uniref:Uncharacterized protein n=1 Tax=Flavivirga aquatica TaxID=1849968 RepID=A0A1E5TC94_9FLAO|nr:hypothetical protein [Flavivirga aquatica]OEK08981.1 hypothetical protein A8C32_13840 [Flavivirga aquatica]